MRLALNCLVFLFSLPTISVGPGPSLSPASGEAKPSVIVDQVKDAPTGQHPSTFPNTLQISSLADASPEEAALAAKSVGYLNQVVASDEFEGEVLVMDPANRFRKNVREGGSFSNRQVFDLMVRKTPLHINVVFYDGDKVAHKGREEGVEESGFVSTVFVNRYAVADKGSNDNQAGFLASLSLHEAMHLLGFMHPRPFVTNSIPYWMNDIYSRTAAKMGLPTGIVPIA